MTRLDELADCHEIVQLTYRYAAAIDGRDWDRLASTLTDDAVIEYIPPDITFSSAKEFADSCRLALEPLDATEHTFFNHQVRLRGDEATVTWNMVAYHVKHGLTAGSLYTIGGTYTDEVVRTPAGWKTTRRTYRAAWGDGNAEIIGSAAL